MVWYGMVQPACLITFTFSSCGQCFDQFQTFPEILSPIFRPFLNHISPQVVHRKAHSVHFHPALTSYPINSIYVCTMYKFVTYHHSRKSSYLSMETGIFGGIFVNVHSHGCKSEIFSRIQV
jgi:hypothetical protein